MDARDLYARLLAAWNARDADAFAALFDDDGVSIGFDGSQATGDEIRTHLGPVFGDHERPRPMSHTSAALARSAPTPSCCGQSPAWSRPAATR
jgi:uncharacterized protein (TIGR02246 family)